jgi:hypothetical protein
MSTAAVVNLHKEVDDFIETTRREMSERTARVQETNQMALLMAQRIPEEAMHAKAMEELGAIARRNDHFNRTERQEAFRPIGDLRSKLKRTRKKLLAEITSD